MTALTLVMNEMSDMDPSEFFNVRAYHCQGKANRRLELDENLRAESPTKSDSSGVSSGTASAVSVEKMDASAESDRPIAPESADEPTETLEDASEEVAEHLPEEASEEVSEDLPKEMSEGLLDAKETPTDNSSEVSKDVPKKKIKGVFDDPEDESEEPEPETEPEPERIVRESSKPDSVAEGLVKSIALFKATSIIEKEAKELDRKVLTIDRVEKEQEEEEETDSDDEPVLLGGRNIADLTNNLLNFASFITPSTKLLDDDYYNRRAATTDEPEHNFKDDYSMEACPACNFMMPTPIPSGFFRR